ncbi:hypothetical protein GGF42_004334 [Coemansia sp. RSA 2424]|nr:hypothetical protein GGF42_004334 [Coemansia sp. RSA 2424]
MAVNLVLIYLFLPETKNLTLEEMDTLFASSVWAFRSAPATRKAGTHCCPSNATTTTTAPSLESYELSTVT